MPCVTTFKTTFLCASAGSRIQGAAIRCRHRTANARGSSSREISRRPACARLHQAGYNQIIR